MKSKKRLWIDAVFVGVPLLGGWLWLSAWLWAGFVGVVVN